MEPDHIRDEGVAEAAPPPYEEPVKAPPYLHDQGIAEAAPPPYGPVPEDEVLTKRYRHDEGIAEAAPPPFDKVQEPAVFTTVRIQTSPVVPLYVDGALVEPPYSLPVGGKAVTIGDPKGAFSVRLRVLERPRNLLLVLDSSQPLAVQGDGRVSGPPWRVQLPPVERPFKLVLENPSTGARIVVRVVARR
jgi:hypothetical protein